ncbi:MAG: hypothetical protein MJ082_04645 [Clostridia bacterium]|nr:hypothetical protein [Clostridia bacterium]
MQEIYIKDPFGDGQTYRFDDSIPKEFLDEIVAGIDENTRQIQSRERKERRHTYSLDAVLYEGMDFADPDSLAEISIVEEEDADKRMETYLSVLTETQRRRCRMRLRGMTYREIASIEGKDTSTIAESFLGIAKKLHKEFPKIFPKNF